MALRNLCAIVADRGSSRRTFAPGKLAVTVTGLPADADWDLYQASDGRWFVALWRSAPEPGGEAANVVVSFATTPAAAAEFNPLVESESVREWSAPTSVTVALDPDVRILAVQAEAAGHRTQRRSGSGVR
jgi:hypothetical protein